MFYSETTSYGRHPIRLVMSVINKRAALEIEVIELNKKQAIQIYRDVKSIGDFLRIYSKQVGLEFW